MSEFNFEKTCATPTKTYPNRHVATSPITGKRTRPSPGPGLSSGDMFGKAKKATKIGEQAIQTNVMTCGNHLRRDMFFEAKNDTPSAIMLATSISETANSGGKIVGYAGSDCVNMRCQGQYAIRFQLSAINKNFAVSTMTVGPKLPPRPKSFKFKARGFRPATAARDC